ncbi:uncharacterized protein SCDLUD_005110 [Saccharomycodes ludwigii]|uniref:uncharacterized protein n=1 Tax=Saccharomycodes ludwigii TaxID=36035 RepID=UPI001E8B3A5A|nr:hypothetical protein SCDLUD_005110 [Saccharomycodes ludwigii]KAH3898775.1 hypothetical protein SCDLUD_005110 [Saccharomycodes ludwigii]
MSNHHHHHNNTTTATNNNNNNNNTNANSTNRNSTNNHDGFQGRKKKLSHWVRRIMQPKEHLNSNTGGSTLNENNNNKTLFNYYSTNNSNDHNNNNNNNTNTKAQHHSKKNAHTSRNTTPTILHSQNNSTNAASQNMKGNPSLSNGPKGSTDLDRQNTITLDMIVEETEKKENKKIAIGNKESQDKRAILAAHNTHNLSVRFLENDTPATTKANDNIVNDYRPNVIIENGSSDVSSSKNLTANSTSNTKSGTPVLFLTTTATSSSKKWIENAFTSNTNAIPKYDNSSTAGLVSTCSSSIKSTPFSDIQSLQSTRATITSYKTLDTTNSSIVGIPPASILDRNRHTSGTTTTPSISATSQSVLSYQETSSLLSDCTMHSSTSGNNNTTTTTTNNNNNNENNCIATDTNIVLNINTGEYNKSITRNNSSYTISIKSDLST